MKSVQIRSYFWSVFGHFSRSVRNNKFSLLIYKMFCCIYLTQRQLVVILVIENVHQVCIERMNILNVKYVIPFRTYEPIILKLASILPQFNSFTMEVPIICSANQRTGFFMIGTSVMKELSFAKSAL